MSVRATPTASRSPRRFDRGSLAWIVALLLGLALIGWDLRQQWVHLFQVSSAAPAILPAPESDAASLTGYAEGRRQMIYPGRSLDGTHWVAQTQQMLATGEWRLRHVTDDNAPTGREQHWGSPYRWWLAACAWSAHFLTGESVASTVESSAMFANPLLFALLLLGLVPWTARRFGPWPAAFLALAIPGLPPLSTLFAADNPDHHGLIQLGAMLGVFALMAGGGGWTRPEMESIADSARLLPTATQARSAYTFSAVVIGLTMWVSAVTLIPILTGIGLGALWGAWAGHKGAIVGEFQSHLWRRWGWVGGLTALVAWLLEYFPHHLGWRMEVNHPVYAVAWIGAGEILAQLTAALSQGKLRPAVAAWKRLVPALLCVLLPGVALLAGGSRVFSAGDGFFWALIHDYVPECQGLLQAWQRAGLNFSTVAQSLPMLALPGALIWSGLRSTPAPIRALAAIPLAATTLIWLLSLRELRWWNVGFGLLPLALVPFLTANALPRLLRWGLVLLFVPAIGETLRQGVQRPAVTADDIQGLAERDLAHFLRQRTGAKPVAVLAAPATTSRLLYFGSLPGLGTTYWENLAGLRRSAEIYAAGDLEEAHRLVRAAGITHLVFLSWDDFAEPYVRLARGLPKEAAIAKPAFVLNLLRSSEPPPWLQELPYSLPAHPALRGQSVRIFEVTDRTSPAQVLVRQVNRVLDYREPFNALALQPALEKLPADLAAQIALARLGAMAGDSATYAAAMERIEGLHDQDAALEPEAHLQLIALYLLSDLTGEARTHLESTLPLLDESTVRRLSPGARANLIAFTKQLSVSWPDPNLHRLALRFAEPEPEK